MEKKYRYIQKNVHDIPVEGSFVRVWGLEAAANSQMIKKAFTPLCKTGFVHPYVALMPDYHPGEGSMVGSVIPTKDVLLPSVIGGDLGCGMTAIKLAVYIDDMREKLSDIHQTIRERIPLGTAHNSTVTKRVQDNPIWNHNLHAPIFTERLRRKLMRQFASMGGGNHFIEIQQDQEGQLWVMLHSGSRYLGVIIRDYYIDKGSLQNGIDSKLYSRIPYLDVRNPLASEYLRDLQYAVDFARESRREMMIRFLEVFSEHCSVLTLPSPLDMIDSSYETAHNYIAHEEHFGEKLFIHRKGAIRVAQDEVGLVPGSMGTNSYIVSGRGNQYSYCSCSHGAGRLMSRGDAFRTISDKAFQDSMSDVIYQHDDRIKDEAPMAYKEIQKVMRGQKDLVKILFELKSVVSIKGC